MDVRLVVNRGYSGDINPAKFILGKDLTWVTSTYGDIEVIDFAVGEG
jgi:hypothetical protein